MSILIYVVFGLIWAYITYKACAYVIKGERNRKNIKRSILHHLLLKGDRTVRD